jgi:hypothetical protein
MSVLVDAGSTIFQKQTILASLKFHKTQQDSLQNTIYWMTGKTQLRPHTPPQTEKCQGMFWSTHLPLLVSSQLEVLATLDGQLFPVLARCALHTQHNLFCRLGLNHAIQHKSSAVINKPYNTNYQHCHKKLQMLK